jgi:DnaK suppressor protein
MFVSILQRFGLRGLRRSGEPLQSRADQNTRTSQSGGPAESVAEGHPEATSQRRQAVTAQKPKASKAPAPTKHAVKVTAKPPVNPKTLIKTVAKPIAKAAKPVVGVKAAVKKSVKPVVKVVAPQKPAVKKAAVEVASRAAPEVVAKPAAFKGTAASKTIKVMQVPVAAKAAKLLKVATAAPAAVAGKKTALPAIAPAPQPAPHPTERSKPMTSPPALKPGRRSSARAPSQLPPPAPMVPTHAPDAAKASYSVMTERVIAPPPHVAAKKDPKLANNWKTKPGNELTDDELKAMPDAEYMNDKQMAFFRHKLSVLKQEIHNSAGETTEHLREETVVVPDPADRATIEEEHALELRTRDRERKLLKKIEQSIGRIDSGDYGYCDETGEPIGVGRLIARPTANLSLEAQQRRELKQKMFGD